MGVSLGETVCFYLLLIRFMYFKNKNKLDVKYDDLISELQDVVVKKYSQHGVSLIKKNISDVSIELSFNIGDNELIAMNVNKESPY
ncbi:hypothetical protein [Photobacterium leiognathi]|nr:hypothetical protein [Photobacterium leiognathi]